MKKQTNKNYHNTDHDIGYFSAYLVRARRSGDDEWPEVAYEVFSGLHLILGSYRLPTDKRVYSGTPSTTHREY
jgi:hypothetical protein